MTAARECNRTKQSTQFQNRKITSDVSCPNDERRIGHLGDAVQHQVELHRTLDENVLSSIDVPVPPEMARGMVEGEFYFMYTFT